MWRSAVVKEGIAVHDAVGTLGGFTVTDVASGKAYSFFISAPRAVNAANSISRYLRGQGLRRDASGTPHFTREHLSGLRKIILDTAAGR